MAFSDNVRIEIFNNSGGQCECKHQHAGEEAPHHGGRCPTTFLYNGAWEADHIVAERAGGHDTSGNATALCRPCYELRHLELTHPLSSSPR